MGLADASAKIKEANKQLMIQWDHLKASWQDQNAKAFETTVIETLGRETEKSHKAMKQMALIIQHMKRDCQ